MCPCAEHLGILCLIHTSQSPYAVIILPILQVGKLTARGAYVIKGYKATSDRAQGTSPVCLPPTPHLILIPLGFAAAKKPFLDY